MSLQQIADSLHDRFRLLTGGARTAVRRQQTLRASVDWSHALLTEPEQVLFRRLAAFAGGFDLDAAAAVGAGNEVESYQLLDQLSLLVDKSLVVADDTGDGMRYRLLETVRQYAQEKLGESGEADRVRTRHRDYYAQTAAAKEARGHAYDEQLLAWAKVEIDNLRAAFAWSRENGELETALQILLSLRPLWLRGGRVQEALFGLSAILAEDRSRLAPAVWVGAVARYAILAGFVGFPVELGRAQEALAVARDIGDPALLRKALIACGLIAIYAPGTAEPYLTEAVELARAAHDQWSLCEIFSCQGVAAVMAGEPGVAIPANEQGRQLADAIGDKFFSQNCRAWQCIAVTLHGDPARGIAIAESMIGEAETDGDSTMAVFGYVTLGQALAYHGQPEASHAAAQTALEIAAAMGAFFDDAMYAVLASGALAAGDAAAARTAAEMAYRQELFTKCITPMAEALQACGDLEAARRSAEETLAVVPGCYRMLALLARANVALAQGEPEQAEHDAQEALTVAANTQAFIRVDDILECLATLAAAESNHAYAVRLLGAADAQRRRIGHPRLPMYQADYDTAVASAREALPAEDFDTWWAEGAALSIDEAIAYAQRGRGERKRPSTGWGSLTPMELDVVRLVQEGLGNKDIGARLFISPRTVQTHLTHVYAKLGVTSRVQLAQQAGR